MVHRFISERAIRKKYQSEDLPAKLFGSKITIALVISPALAYSSDEQPGSCPDHHTALHPAMPSKARFVESVGDAVACCHDCKRFTVGIRQIAVPETGHGEA